MACPTKLHFLTLGLLALFVLLSVATVHANSNYAYGTPRVDGDDDDGGDDDSGYDHKYKSRDGYGRPDGDDDDDDEEEEGYKRPTPKKNDYHKGGYEKPAYEEDKPKEGYGKPEKDDDDDNENDDDDESYGGKYDHGAGYGKPKHDEDDENRGGYGKPSKGDDKYPDGDGKPKKDDKDDATKYGKDKPEDEDDEYDDGKGPKKDDKGHHHGGYDKPSKEDKHPKPAPYSPEVVPKSISVEGVVLCQNCKNVGSDSLANAKPIAGAKVKLVCQTGPRYKTFLYATATTDSNGFFLISVPHFDFKKFLPVEDCVVVLVSSPLKECSAVTGINMGKSGGLLRPIPTFAPSENLMFSVGPFAFAPQQCSSKPPPAYTPQPSTPAPTKRGQSPPPAYGGGSHY